MSDDLIRRSDAIKAMEELSEHYTDEGREWHPHIDFVLDELRKIPTVEPKRGEWIVHSNGKMCDCSVCNESYDRTFEYVDEWNFCPNCGADMRGADNEH